MPRTIPDCADPAVRCTHAADHVDYFALDLHTADGGHYAATLWPDGTGSVMDCNASYDRVERPDLLAEARRIFAALWPDTAPAAVDRPELIDLGRLADAVEEIAAVVRAALAVRS